MESHSLYRAWRPQRFREMVGQDHIARTLLNALRDKRTVHAYLFTGPRGTGKTSTARILAKAMNCRQPVDGEPCNECDICAAITNGRAMDVIEIDAASNRGIEHIRDLREKVNLSPAEGRYRFYIIDEVHQLSNDASNALLKTLEEPPPHLVFVLATTEQQKILATVVSRCQHYSFHRIADPVLFERLRLIAEHEGVHASPDALQLLARAAAGGLRDGISLLDQAIAYCGTSLDEQSVASMLGMVSGQAVTDFLTYLEAREAAPAMSLLQHVVDEGGDPRQFNNQVVDALRERLCQQTASKRPSMAGTWTVPDLVRATRLFSDVQFGNRLIHIPQLPLELAVVDWCSSTDGGAMAGQHVALTPSPVHATQAPTAAVRPTRPGSAPERAAVGDADLPLRPAVRVPPPPVSAASPENSAEGVPDDLRRGWQRTIEQLKPISRKIAALCVSCQLQGLQDAALILTHPAGLVREQILNLATRRQIEDVLASVFEKTYTVKCLAPRDYTPSVPSPPAPSTERASLAMVADGVAPPPSPVPPSQPPASRPGTERDMAGVLERDSTVNSPQATGQQRQEDKISASLPEARSVLVQTPGNGTDRPVATASVLVTERQVPSNEHLLASASHDPVVQETIRVFGGGRVSDVIPHRSN